MPPRFRLPGLSWLALLLAVPAAAQQPATVQQPAADADDRYRPNYWRDYRLELDYHPIGPVLRKGQLEFSNLIPMHPSGFRADAYNLFIGPTYGLGRGWQVTAGLTTAERLGPGGEAVFYGGGLQKQFVHETKSRPALSLSGYGMAGPHGHHTGTVALSGSKRVFGGDGRRFATFIHGGAKFEAFGSDDYGDGTGIRPYAGATFAFSRRMFLSGEFSPAQPWEQTDMYSIRATYLFRRRIGISGGIRNNGFRTLPFVSLAF